jgi:hypothetical protein
MIAEVVHWNSMAAFGFGVCLNLLTLWIIVRHTPKEMRVYSVLLIQTCVSDLILLALTYIDQPVSGIPISIFLIIFKTNIFHVAHQCTIFYYTKETALMQFTRPMKFFIFVFNRFFPYLIPIDYMTKNTNCIKIS